MFSNIIKELRKKEKYTQAELAAKLSVNQTTVSCWETGKATPPPEMLMTLAQFFGVTVDYLMGNADRGIHPARGYCNGDDAGRSGDGFHDRNDQYGGGDSGRL